MCYTSGTTGHPKAALYSHRALFLHTLAMAMADSFAVSERDTIMPIVPMFHANAWGLPFGATMVGATQVYPGPNPQPKEILELIQRERVTFTAGVPTVWINLLPLLETGQYDVSSIRAMAVGGSAAPKSLIDTYEKKYGVQVIHAWGMTEMSPLGTMARLKSHMERLPEAERLNIRAKQGIPWVGVEIRAVDDSGREVPWNGKTIGELQVRGPCVIRQYYENPEGARQFTDDGWFRTGDVVTIDPEGYIQITDRTKDLIKSGGEWISSVDLENLLMAHPKILEACVIAVPHPKWDERPLACVVPKPGQTLTAEELVEFLRPQVAKWWLPDGIVLMDAIPKTGVGKFDKKLLREQFKAWKPAE
jgi:fatty-acyl-CoA synthase